jgi:nucleoside-diphosphate-sugar epimerase
MEQLPVPLPEEGFLEEPGVDRFVDRIQEAERVVMQAHAEGHYNATHIRYCMTYGPRHLAPAEWSIIRRVLDGRRRLLLPNCGLTLISRGYGANVAHAILLAVDKPDPSAGKIYNSRDDTLLTNRQWIELIARIMGHEFEFVDMPLSIIQKGYSYAHPAALMYPFHQVMDIAKIKSELAYQDVVPVEQAMEQTVKWYLENRPAPGSQLEKNIMDPFDYATDDRLLKQLDSTWDQLRRSVGTEYTFRHPYAHPRGVKQS